jgi:hypothetical protein
MSTGGNNQAIYLAASESVGAKLYLIATRVAFPASGAVRSLPAEQSSTSQFSGVRPPTTKEHPVEPSVAAAPLEASPDVADGPSLEPKSQF